MAAIHVDLSGLAATGETGLGGCGDVSYPDLDNLVRHSFVSRSLRAYFFFFYSVFVLFTPMHVL